MVREPKHYILTRTAEREFRDAKRWSQSRWGNKLTKDYFAKLHRGAQYIALNQDALGQKEYLTGTVGLGIYAVGEHYIVFVPISGSQIIIVALIRQSRDVPAILKSNGHLIRQQLKEIMRKFTKLQ